MRGSVDRRGKQPGPVEGRIDTNQSWEIKIVRNSLRDKLSLTLFTATSIFLSFLQQKEFAPLLWPDDLDVEKKERKGKKGADDERIIGTMREGKKVSDSKIPRAARLS